MDPSHADTLRQLSTLSAHELSIIRISEPLSANAIDAHKRSSDASADAFDNPTPASLAADLAHYKEYFSKLRFSYLEQVTKEKFLRAIVGDPPQVVEHQENVELEAQLVAVKAELKAQKEEVAGMVAELEQRGRLLAERYEVISLQKTQLSELPTQIAVLEDSITTLQAEQVPSSTDPTLSLPLGPTLELVAAKQAELDELNRQLKTLQQALPRKTRELERAEGELRPLEVQSAAALAAARQARQRKEDGDRGIGDALELKGRWYRGVEAGLRDALDIRA